MLLPYSSIAHGQNSIDVSLVGLSDEIQNNLEVDRLEAIYDAKLKTLEMARIDVSPLQEFSSQGQVHAWIDAVIDRILLPDYQIVDVGYGAENRYTVVFIGRWDPSGREIGESEGDKLYRMAVILLEEENDKSRGLFLLKEVVEKYPDCLAADDALYQLILHEPNEAWVRKHLLHLRAFYHDSPFIPDAQKYLDNWKENKRREALESFEFVLIPGGTFLMGSENGTEVEKPIREVAVNSFEIMTTEVTQEQWQAVMNANPSKFRGNRHPVEQVSWNDAKEFIRRLNKLKTEHTYRLPAEAEWEYACRAGNSLDFPTGNHEEDLDAVGWYKENSEQTTHPVGLKLPNAYGLYDMHGNVWEWCEDWYRASYFGAPSTSEPVTSPPGDFRVTRGGSWFNHAELCRATHRAGGDPHDRGSFLGLRLVREPLH